MIQSAIFAQPSNGSPRRQPCARGEPAIPSDQTPTDAAEPTPPPGDAMFQAFAPPTETPGTPPPAPHQQAGPYPPAGPQPQGPWGHPYPGYPGHHPGFPGWVPPPPPTGWNGFAITSLVLGIIGIACCLWVGAIAFGIAALRAIPQRNQRGKGMAVAGIVLGAVWGALLIAVAASGVLDRVGDHTDDRGVRTGRISVDDLRVGDCYARPKDLDRATRLTLVGCASAHYGEVYAVGNLPKGDYPGEEKVTAAAEKLCSTNQEKYTMDDRAVPDQTDLFYYYPQKTGWEWADDRQVTCVYSFEHGDRTGSLRRDASNLTAEQMTYLNAVKPFNTALLHSPDAEDPAEDPEAYRAWAKELADGADAEAKALESATWTTAATRQAVADLVVAVRKEGTHFRAASQSTDPAAIERELDDANSGAAAIRATVVRTALDLATGHSRGSSPTTV
ncbi:DUF4190 domain-containing protein [Kitasatospora sp. NPDC088346]|uniref:DUF4190 domain-containing protein n=1 Tax=Kitasatospora sp. NPDC088346 TaxID=3364073 RepID=UPI0037F5F2F1